MKGPAVSLIMSVYNGADLVAPAIESIFAQTFKDFELIAIDNGSFKDDTRALLHRIRDESGDERLRVIELDENIGLAGALNHGLTLARGAYIARQDHDDLSHPTRLEKQVAYMEAHRECGLLGTAAEIWVSDTPSDRWHDHPADNGTLQADLLANNPFVHTSIMTRREVIDRIGPYTRDPARQPPEDYELWSRIARHYPVANLPERLVVYREMPSSMSRDSNNPFLERLLLISAENVAFWNGWDAPTRDCHTVAALLHAQHARVPADAQIDEIVAVFEGAISGIEKAYPGEGARKRGEWMAANVRHHFVHARVLPAWAKPLVPIARKIPVASRVRRYLGSWLAR